MEYKKGNTIHGYELLTNFSTKGGGQCEWVFARKNGSEYFIKRFLNPKYMESTSTCLGETVAISAKDIEKNRIECNLFENKHNKIIGLLREYSGGGNLVTAVDFFRQETKYYKVTPKVNVASDSVEQISHLPLEKRILFLKTLSHSLGLLHNINLVHGDLKPDNVIVKKTSTGNLVAALIDFDDSCFSGEPSFNREEVVGDQNYYSPELGRYISEDEKIFPKDITCKSDIFALGIMFCQYLTGKLPMYKHEIGEPYIAALNKEILNIDPGDLPRWLQNLVNVMLRVEPKHRPGIDKILDCLKNSKELIGMETDDVIPISSGGLKGTLMSKKDTALSSEPVSHSTLKGTGLRKS